jgi:hypothetical protein
MLPSKLTHPPTQDPKKKFSLAMPALCCRNILCLSNSDLVQGLCICLLSLSVFVCFFVCPFPRLTLSSCNCLFTS